MDDEQLATGGHDAILIDTLLGLGIDVDRLISMSRAERMDALATAANSGQLGPDRINALRRLGLLPDSN